MKNKASVIIKQIMAALSSIAKAKSIAIKNKTSAFKARLIVFSLLKQKKVIMDSLSHKIHRLLGQNDKENNDEIGEQGMAIVLYNAMRNKSQASSSHTQLIEKAEADEDDDDDDDDKYPDLRHSLFDEEDLEFEDQGGSIIDLVRNAKEGGENFNLEDEIDHVADLFILRFHKQMRMQKLDSFKRYQEMLQRSL
ncbi:hypothetical protein SO802_012326 [Lithocarpus litseifolius]|uniref:DUF761 domain-containing protein n=1 Tax=Lithocarpus litseifolius TaxID=425828 RepID=A0AAW2D6I0_9ROSI